MDPDDPVSLAAHLVRNAWGKRAAIASLEALAGDASSRRYFRVRLSGAGPATAVLMVQSGSGLSISSDELSSISQAPTEMPFLNVQRYLRSCGVPVPEVYAADSPCGIAFLEDVGDTTLWAAARAASDPAILYRAAVEGIVELQAAGRRRRDEGCIAFQQRFDRRLFLWELDHFLEYGFGGRDVPNADRTRLRAHFERIAERLAASPADLAHRDYHSWNLFVQDGRIRVIDFQDALFAPPTYDLASLLTDRMTPELVRPALEHELLELFARRRAESLGERPDLAALREIYFETALQRALKVVGRFHYLEVVKGKRGYVAMLPNTLATVRHCLESLPALAELRDILARFFAELR